MTPTRFAAALSEHPVASHAVGEVAGEIMERFGGDEPDLVVCFASPHFVGAMEDLAFALGNLLEPRVMLGATTVAVVGGPREVCASPRLAAGRPAHASRARRGTPDGAAITGWSDLITSVEPLPPRPVQLPGRRLLRRLNDDGRRSHRSVR
jgi:small ligand-binding sensory domain FIST